MSKYYCWLQYYDNDTLKQSSSDEIKFEDKHKHGAQPSNDNWNACLDSLVLKVNGLRKPPLMPLSRDTINSKAEKKTRSEH
ncbi:MAG: hypothetical protein JW783_14305 [Bacteroidales bacterium]|nr:hypothetical protein [Bacteroidales bacterium]MBN2749726.1 hypothetical protein [Bacteroidales bacterium]